MCSYSDYTDNSLCALLKLFVYKSSTDSLSVQKWGTGMRGGTQMPKTDRRVNEDTALPVVV